MPKLTLPTTHEPDLDTIWQSWER